MSNIDYRPCSVKGKSGMFHEWVQTSMPIHEDRFGGKAPAGQLTQVFAIVEYEDGSISLEQPCEVVFTDLLAKKINFTERKIDKWKSLS